MKITKRLSIFITIFVLIFGVQFIKPKKAEAVFGIADTDVGSLMTAVKEYGIDTLVTILNNRIMDKLINDTVNWAKGGFDGDPGYINNWDGFLEGVKHDALSNALKMATNEAYKQQGKQNKASEEEKQKCLTDVTTIYQDNLNKVEKSKNYHSYLEENYSVSSCSDLNGSAINDCYSDPKVIATMYPYTLADVTTAEIVNNNYEKDKNNCDYISQGVWGDVGNIVENNYNMYMNSGVINARSVASTVVQYGAKKLNENTLNSLIKGEGNTIKYLLGSQENVDNFKNDFKYGGWVGYMALADPHNTPDGVNSMVKNILSAQTNSSTSIVDKAVQDLQTKKFGGKKKCVEWEDNTDNVPNMSEEAQRGGSTSSAQQSNTSTGGVNTDRKCIRYETVTPGSLVESSMKDVMGSDKKRSMLARELSDVLASALGRLTNKLIQVGIDKLQEKAGKQSAMNNLGDMVNDQFGNTYQDEYDVLGIADDARIFNNNGEQGDDNTTTEGENGTENKSDYKKSIGGDASIPYIGGPEDLVGLNWNDGPELVVELKGNLEKSLKLVKEYLDLNLKISAKLKSAKENVAILDYCRPGPDFNWEKRYKDKANFIMGQFKENKEDEDRCSQHKFTLKEELFDVGLPTIKEMNSDPAINIPGSTEMTNIISEVLGDKNKELINSNRDAKIKKRSMYNILLRISEEAENDIKYKTQKNKIDSRLTLFLSKIHKEEVTTDDSGKETIKKINILTDNDLKEILGIKVILVKETGELIGLDKKGNITKASLDKNGNIKTTPTKKLVFDGDKMTKEYLIEYRDLYSFKDNKQENSINTQEINTTPETPETLVASNRDKAEEIVIDLAWNIWRRNVDKDIKSKLRYQYYTIRNNLVTEQDILELKIDSKKAIDNSSKIADYVLDCIVFLAVTKDEYKDKNSKIRDRSDYEIKNILEKEYIKQQNNDPNNPSIFKTNLYTSPTNINLSILKFVNNKNGDTLKKHFKEVYPDVYKEAKSVDFKGIGTNINEILDLDETGRTVMLNKTKTIFDENETNLAVFQALVFASPGKLLIKLFKKGTDEKFNPNEGKELFCNIKIDHDPGKCVKGTWDFNICTSVKDTNSKYKVAQRWYFGNKIAYSAAFAGI